MIKKVDPFLIHAYQFFRHFALFFLLPISVVSFSAVVAGALFRLIHRKFIARYSTPEELFEDALKQLKRHEDTRRALSRPSSLQRERALSTLRLVNQLKPGMMQPYIVLATELFYGYIESTESDKGKRNSNESLRRRGDAASTSNLSPALHECQQVITQGLVHDPKNRELLTLQNELQLVNKYGSKHTKMISIGHFGWMGR